VTSWKEDDVLSGQRTKALVAILRTRGCWWARGKGCSMCGYNVESLDDITVDDLRHQLDKVMAKYDGERLVKIYTSGSLLDEREIPLDFRQDIFKAFSQSEKVLFESRPEFITQESVSTLPKGRAMVALGLESANDEILTRSIWKGFNVADYHRAATVLNEMHVPVRTYLLLKPPFLTERQGMQDALASIKYAGPFSESISINPINVQSGTMVEDLWRRGDYRPPWLWSLVEVLREGRALTDSRIMSAPSGGGTIRGAHNCEKCDRKVLDAIERFTFSQDSNDLEGLTCTCLNEWRGQMRLQGMMHTSVDLERHLGDGLEL
jgi:radical SAM enzyme (TIGR01210 family)